MNYWKLFLKLLNDCVNALIVRLLVAWYCNQICCVRWRSTFSTGFHMSNGTRQGGVLFPYLFTRYIREMLGAIVDSGIGCLIVGMIINVLAYADDLVLTAPSWKALQLLLGILDDQAADIDMHCTKRYCSLVQYGLSHYQKMDCQQLTYIHNCLCLYCYVCLIIFRYFWCKYVIKRSVQFSSVYCNTDKKLSA